MKYAAKAAAERKWLVFTAKSLSEAHYIAAYKFKDLAGEFGAIKVARILPECGGRVLVSVNDNVPGSKWRLPMADPNAPQRETVATYLIWGDPDGTSKKEVSCSSLGYAMEAAETIFDGGVTICAMLKDQGLRGKKFAVKEPGGPWRTYERRDSASVNEGLDKVPGAQQVNEEILPGKVVVTFPDADEKAQASTCQVDYDGRLLKTCPECAAAQETGREFEDTVELNPARNSTDYFFWPAGNLQLKRYSLPSTRSATLTALRLFPGKKKIYIAIMEDDDLRIVATKDPGHAWHLHENTEMSILQDFPFVEHDRAEYSYSPGNQDKETYVIGTETSDVTIEVDCRSAASAMRKAERMMDSTTRIFVAQRAGVHLAIIAEKLPSFPWVLMTAWPPTDYYMGSTECKKILPAHSSSVAGAKWKADQELTGHLYVYKKDGIRYRAVSTKAPGEPWVDATHSGKKYIIRVNDGLQMDAIKYASLEVAMQSAIDQFSTRKDIRFMQIDEVKPNGNTYPVSIRENATGSAWHGAWTNEGMRLRYASKGGTDFLPHILLKKYQGGQK